MASFAQTQIQPPADEQVFERASVVLWRHILKDPNVQKNGRRGQRQDGVDIFGHRNGNAAALVGIQCKLKSLGQRLTRKEVLSELRKALKFIPPLKEFFIVTTAPDDAHIQEIARRLTSRCKTSRGLSVHIWGWNTLQERIAEFPEAMRSFDPSFTMFGDELLSAIDEVKAQNLSSHAAVIAAVDRVQPQTSAVRSTASADFGYSEHSLLDPEIDSCRNLIEGKPETALALLIALRDRVASTASPRELFRIESNIGASLNSLGREQEAGEHFLRAYAHYPTDPRAQANKALGFLLLDDAAGAVDFATRALEQNPTNGKLASYLLAAAARSSVASDPYELLPAGLHDDESVLIAVADFLRFRELVPAWWEATERGSKLFPSNPLLRRLSAEARIDRALRSDSADSSTLDDAAYSEVVGAAESLQLLWDKDRKREGGLRPYDSPSASNLIVAYRLIGNAEAAAKVASEAMEADLREDHVLIHSAIALFEAGQPIQASRTAAKISDDNPEKTLLLFQIAGSEGDWATIKALAANIDQVPQSERGLLEAVVAIANLSTSAQLSESDIASAATLSSMSARGSSLLADFANKRGFPVVARAALANAVAALQTDPHAASRLMVASSAQKQSAWSSVISTLLGRISEARDTEGLRLLATAFANERPPTKPANDFFRRLNPALLQEVFYARARGVLQYAGGDLDDALVWMKQVANAEPESAFDLISLNSIYARKGTPQEIEPFIRSLRTWQLKGTPKEKLGVAQIMLLHGRSDDAVALGYEVTRDSPNSKEAMLGYFGLMMLDESKLPVMEQGYVSNNSWVLLEEEASREKLPFVISDSLPLPGETTISPTDDLAKALVGKKVGDQVVRPTAIGEPKRWTILEIKHKYIHMLHYIMKTFEVRFPNQGIWSVNLKDNDIQPILDYIKKFSENNQAIAELYFKEFPLFLLAHALGGTTISVAAYLRSLGKDIQTCVGTDEERLDALARLKISRSTVAVFDAYSAWVAASIGVIPLLEKVFCKLILPQTELDEIREFVPKKEFNQEEHLQVSWDGKQFFRTVMTKEQFENALRHSAAIIDVITSSMSIVPADTPVELPELARAIVEQFDHDTLASFYVALDQRACLVSEDLYARRFAEQTFGIKGFWLTAIIQYGLENALISLPEDARLIGELALWKHAHLSISMPTLRQILSANSLEAFDAAAHFIGSKQADFPQHVQISRAFLQSVWSAPSFIGKREKATGTILDNLLKHRWNQWEEVIRFVAGGGNPELAQYADGWKRGHFLV